MNANVTRIVAVDVSATRKNLNFGKSGCGRAVFLSVEMGARVKALIPCGAWRIKWLVLPG